MKNTLSEIMELFSGILVIVNGLVNMITSGLLGKPMINTDTWRLPPFVFILSWLRPFMVRNRRKNMSSII